MHNDIMFCCCVLAFATSTDSLCLRAEELEAVCNPIMMKLYGAGGAEGGMPGGGMPGGPPPGGDDDGGAGPTIDEVD